MATVAYLVVTVKDIIIARPLIYARSVYSNPTKVLFLLALVAVMICIEFRYTCGTYGEDVLSTLIIVFLGVYSLYFGR